MSTTHSDHHYSVTIHTDDLALVACLRALSQHSQKSGNARIPWGGTKREDWSANGHKVTFRFSQIEYREGFIGEIQRLLTGGTFQVVSMRDDDPASPQSDFR